MCSPTLPSWPPLEAAIQKNTDVSVYYWMAGSSPAMTEERTFTVGSMGSPAAGNIGIIKLGDDALDANDTAELPGNPGSFPYERRFCRGRR
jgi:hypothetical protein